MIFICVVAVLETQKIVWTSKINRTDRWCRLRIHSSSSPTRARVLNTKRGISIGSACVILAVIRVSSCESLISRSSERNMKNNRYFSLVVCELAGLGKRGWRIWYGVIRDLVLLLFKDDELANGRVRGRRGSKTGKESRPEAVVHLHHALALVAKDYTKRQNVFRLYTADQAEYLFLPGSVLFRNIEIF